MRREDTKGSDHAEPARRAEDHRARRRRAGFDAALLGSILLCGIGGWYALGGRAAFQLGGDPESVHERNHVIHVDAHGYDAVAIGVFFVGLGVVNLALGIPGRARIPIFWLGAGLVVTALLYGLVNAMLAVGDAFA